MPVKPRDKPTHLLRMEALSRRLTPNHKHKKFVDNLARNLRTGYNGEKSLDFILGFFPKDQFHILHNLRIKDEHGYFQIDTLVVSRYFALIIEVKNIYGTITFDNMGQAVRTVDDGTEQNFSSPLEQVTLQESRLRRWVRSHRLPPYPLEKVIVYSNYNTILKNITNNETISQMVIHKESLLRKVEEYKEVHTTQSLTNTQLDKIILKLIAAHTPKIVNAMDKYEVSQYDLLLGIICGYCSVSPMLRYKGKWLCQECNGKSKTAHVAALQDYRILVGNTITNGQARSFLMISSVNVAKKLLQKERLKFTGNTSARKYFLS